MNWQQFLEQSFPARMDQEVRIGIVKPDGSYASYPVMTLVCIADEVLITAEVTE